MSSNPYGRLGGGRYSYYTPGTSYGSGTWGPGEFNQTPLADEYFQKERQSAFVRFLAENGWDESTTAGQWAGSQFNRLDAGYGAALGDNPMLQFRDYLSMEGPKLQQFYNSLSYQDRGERPGQFAPRVRQQFRR